MLGRRLDDAGATGRGAVEPDGMGRNLYGDARPPGYHAAAGMAWSRIELAGGLIWLRAKTQGRELLGVASGA